MAAIEGKRVERLEAGDYIVADSGRELEVVRVLKDGRRYGVVLRGGGPEWFEAGDILPVAASKRLHSGLEAAKRPRSGFGWLKRLLERLTG